MLGTRTINVSTRFIFFTVSRTNNTLSTSLPKVRIATSHSHPSSWPIASNTASTPGAPLTPRCSCRFCGDWASSLLTIFIFIAISFTLHILVAVHVHPPWAALDTLRLGRTEPVEKSSLVALATVAANSTLGGTLLLLSFVVSSIFVKRIFASRWKPGMALQGNTCCLDRLDICYPPQCLVKVSRKSSCVRNINKTRTKRIIWALPGQEAGLPQYPPSALH